MSTSPNAQSGSNPTEKGTKFRLVTRSDFDGLVCAVLLKHMEMIDDILFAHPKDMQDGKIEITERDITTNLPYVPGVHMAFDHHLSETIRNKDQKDNHYIDPNAMSAARVVFDHYGGYSRFPKHWHDMMDAVDKADAAQYSLDEILNPSGWTLLNYLMDPRTGLGRFREFRISNYNLMMNLIDYCKDQSIEAIMEVPDVKERVELYNEQSKLFQEQVRRCSTIHDNLIVLDLRNEETIYAGNRFMIYAMPPECNISIHVLWGLKQQNTVYAIGKSIVNRSSKTNVGELCLQYGGGGHEKAGTCQIANDQAEATLKELVQTINADGEDNSSVLLIVLGLPLEQRLTLPLERELKLAFAFLDFVFHPVVPFSKGPGRNGMLLTLNGNLEVPVSAYGIAHLCQQFGKALAVHFFLELHFLRRLLGHHASPSLSKTGPA